MSEAFHIVVCGSLVPDPLQSLEPVESPQGPALKNEAMLPAVLDPWAAHSLFEAAHLAKQNPESKVWLVALGPKAKLQQLMMTTAQKVPFDLVVLDGKAGGFTDSHETAAALAEAISGIADLDQSRLLLFGGCASATRDSGTTMQLIGEQLGITEQFMGVDALEITEEGKLRIKERIEGGRYLVSECMGAPAVLAWATGSLPIPPNNPQVGMQNMRTIMPKLQQAKPVNVGTGDIEYSSATVPKQKRETRIERDMPPDEIARELAEWIRS
jgi:electron transfer flavoprotein beta subunit